MKKTGFSPLYPGRTLAFLIPAMLLLCIALTPLAPASAGYHTLTGVLPEHASIDSVQFTPDSQTVVFRADIDQADVHEIYSVPISGATKLEPLNPPLVKGGDVFYSAISPDGSRLLYVADQDVDERLELYSVPIGGGEVAKLNGPLGSGGNILGFKFDPQRNQVLYLADQDINDVPELYSAPIQGGSWKKISAPLPAGGGILSYQIEPVSERVVYTARTSSSSLYQLYSVSIDGGLLIKINQPVSKDILSFAVTPGFSSVLYIAREAGSTKDELFVNNLLGTAKAKRNVALASDQNVIAFKISPNGAQVVYNVANSNHYDGDLWRTEPFSGPSQQLTSGAAVGYGVRRFEFSFTSDSRRVVYIYHQDQASPKVFQSVRADGGVLHREDLYTQKAGHIINRTFISPDSQWVVLEEYDQSTLLYELYALPVEGGAIVPFGSGLDPRISPDSQRVVYYHWNANTSSADLLSTQIFGGGLRNLTQMEEDSFAYYPVISPDGRWIVYQVNLPGDSGFELRVSDGQEPLPPTPTATPSETPVVTSTPVVTPAPPSGGQENNTFLPFLGK